MEREKGVGVKWGDIHLIPNFAFAFHQGLYY